jgi:hypothetical protein
MGDRGRDLSKGRASRFVAGGLVVAVLASLIAVSSAARASADEVICGKRVQTEYSYDLDGLQEMLKRGNQYNIDQIRRALSLGEDWCGPIGFVVDVLAEMVVSGTLMDVVKVEVPGGIDVVVTSATQLQDRLKRGDWPARLPDVGPSGSVFLAPVAWTGGIGLNLRPSPARTAVIGTVPEGATVSIQCSTRGETVSGPFGPTNLWDYVVYNGQAGYVSDGYVNTGTNDPVAPSC